RFRVRGMDENNNNNHHYRYDSFLFTLGCTSARQRTDRLAHASPCYNPRWLKQSRQEVISLLDNAAVSASCLLAG
ncbi:MAG: hypothetical protein AAFO91_07255, partial [Bacteroidota bacterium]